MKKWYLSKTVWMQVLALVAVVVPASSKVISEHFAAAGMGWAIVNLVLRAITKQELSA